MFEVMGFRCCATGIYSYDYLIGEKRLCTMGSVVAPSVPVNISGSGFRWISCFDSRSAALPDAERTIIDEATGNLLFRIVRSEPGRYSINAMVDIICGEDDYSFYYDNVLITRIERIRGTKNITVPLKNIDYEPYFFATAADGINEQYLIAALSFPLLRF